MAEYLVTSPDGTKYRVTGPDGATDEQVLAQVKAYKPPVARAEPSPAPIATKAPKPTEPADEGTASQFVLGNLNIGIAGVAGLPVDIARNALNLGIAGYGAVKGAMGGTPPDLIQPGPGSSQSFENLFRRMGSITPGAEPQSMAGRYAASALQMLPGAMMGRGTMAQVPARAAAGATSGLAGEAAGDILGEEYRGAGAMLPAAGRLAKPPTTSERATAARQAEIFKTAKDNNIPIPPRAMKPDAAQQSIVDTVNKELKQPPGTDISPNTLKTFRSAYAGDYEAVKKSPALANGVKPTPTFQARLQDIGQDVQKAKNNLPETFKSMGPVLSLLGEYGYGQMPGGRGTLPPRAQPIPADVAMRAIKKLRSDATTNLMNENPEKVELGRVQRKLSLAIEDLIDEQLSKSPLSTKDEIAKWREARTAIAKSYDVESSLDPTTRKVSGSRLSQLLTEGRPLTGGLKDLAEVGGEFPEAMKSPRDQDYFTHRVTPMAMTHPEAAATHWATRLWDPITLSKIYQSAFVDPAKKLSPEQQRLLRFTAAAQQANRPGQIDAPPQE
jgi:hypothetical protein